MPHTATDAPVLVSTFYHFAPIDDPRPLRAPTLARMESLGVRGTITFANEGLNATISGTAANVALLVDELRQIPGMKGIEQRPSHTTTQPFARSKVRIKRELISLSAEANPSVCVGTYVAPGEWNAIITRPDTILIDTRNDYEFAIGHFTGAINPTTRNFKEMVGYTQEHLDPAKHTHIAMYCTGGIRCEKYSSYLVRLGFTGVYHLKGGILAYLETVPESESLWQGECYVFDERVAVCHGLVPSKDATMCLGCGRPLYSADRAHAAYVVGNACEKCA